VADAERLAGNFEADPTCAKLLDALNASPNRPVDSTAFTLSLFIEFSGIYVELWAVEQGK
jgi:hypothetical protein